MIRVLRMRNSPEKLGRQVLTVELKPMLLNLGSGPRATSGWLCIDRSRTIQLDRIAMVRRILVKTGVLKSTQSTPWDPQVKRLDFRNLPFSDQTFDAVYSSHALEHVYLNEARMALREALRVLRIGGILRLALPDSEGLARTMLRSIAEGDQDAGLMFNERLLAFPGNRPTTALAIRRALGGPVHRWQPTRDLVRKMLAEAGFDRVTDCDFGLGQMPGLTEIETRPHSIFLEAIRPASQAEIRRPVGKSEGPRTSTTNCEQTVFER